MTPRARPAAFLLAGLAFASAGCSLRGLSGPSRDEVLAQLQNEANEMKKGGEQMDPKLRVKVTWTVDGIDLVEQAGDSAHPWKGTVRFKIVSTMHDSAGSKTNDLIRKNFTYVYDS